MRAPVLITTLLALSASPAFAQDEARPPASASQPAPGVTRPDSPPGEAGRDRDAGRMMDRMGPGIDWDHRKAGRDWRMRGADDDVGRDRGYRSADRADRDGYGKRSDDEDRPRRRVKVCFEYDNGDEYCRYRD